ncbi:MAG: Ig-like domain-containing protein [Acidobacteriaceae bacterium]
MAACGVNPGNPVTGGTGGGQSSPEATLVSIAVTPAAPSLLVGSTQQLTATGSYSDGSSQDITSSAQWTSATASVASVNSSGLATALSPGTSTVTASLGSISGSATLTVTAAAPTLVSISITPAAASVAVGSTQQFSAIGTYSDESTADLTRQVTWSVANSHVASISAAGLASAAQIGFTQVTAALDGISGTANLAVVGVPRYLYDLSDAGRDVSRLTINASTGQPRYLGYQSTNSYHNVSWGCLSIDPSEKYAYVTTQVQDSGTGADVANVLDYSINATTGALTLLPGSPYTLSEPISCIQFLPGGNFAYATPGIEGTGNHLVTLAKDASGNLSVVNSITLPSYPDGLTIDPQGKFLYVASEVITVGGNAYAYGYTIDSTTGALTPIDGTPLQLGVGTYGYFSFDPSGNFLYFADSADTAIRNFSVNRDSGALTASAGVVNPCVNPNAVRFTPDGQYAFTSCSTGGVVSFSVGSAGQLTPIATAPTKAVPQGITVDPSGQFLYLISDFNYLSTYKIDGDGTLSLFSHTAGRFLESSIAILSGTAPVTYTTQSAYLTSSGDNRLASYTVNSDGTLTPVQTAITLQSPFSLTTLPWASDLLLASSAAVPNLEAYTAMNNAGAFTGGYSFGDATVPGGLIMDPSGTVAFASDSSSGRMSWYWQTAPGLWTDLDLGQPVPPIFVPGAGAGLVAMDPSGRYLFVANQSTNSIWEFQFAGAAPVPALPLPASPLALCTGPTGNHVFVAGNDDQLRMLTVDLNGNLTDSFDIGLPATPTSVAVEPTGKTVYVTSGSGISAFTINQQAGTLSALPLSISAPLANATGVYIDPSGQDLYVSVSTSTANALYLLTINPDGTLSSAGTTPVATPNKATSMAFHAQIQ